MEKANKIMGIWRKQPCFVRFVDGDTTNCAASNLEWVDLIDAMKNSDWTVDWDMHLSRKQTEFVRANHMNFVYLLSPNEHAVDTVGHVSKRG